LQNIYEKIRQENEKFYGEGVGFYGVYLADKLYSDRTHLIYELIQNAEDASKRANKEGKNQFSISFSLFPDRLEVRNNGAIFSETDIKGISKIGEGTKKNDLTQIGKFGLGFKSVYAYTKSPEIHSGNESFNIKNYVFPYEITKKQDLDVNETLFIIPFNHEEITPEKSFNEIKNRLKNLGSETLLFLRYIKEINWNIANEKGTYLRKSISNGSDFRNVEISSNYSSIGINHNLKEKYLIFERPINGSPDFPVEIAYKLIEDFRYKDKLKITPILGAKLSVFFLTNIDTRLKFIIQGPYRTTPARDNIHFDDEWNQILILETATLVSDSISKVKELGYLNISFLNTLPLEDEYLDNLIYNVILNQVYLKLSSDEKFLPTNNNDYTNSENALIARTDDIRQLISKEQINSLFEKDEGDWIISDITRDKESTIFKYLSEKLEVPVIDNEAFSRRITKEFLENQTDKWIINFYSFLTEKPALWRGKTSIGVEGILRNKEIIRLEDGTHSSAFDKNGEPIIYIPGEHKINFPTLKRNLILDDKIKIFFRSFGLREADLTDVMVKGILLKYSYEDTVKIENKDENIQDVSYIFKTLKTLTYLERNRLIDCLKSTTFLMVKDFSGDIFFNSPENIYIGKEYTGKEDLEIYFEDYVNFLVPDYKDFLDLHQLKEIGCKDKIEVLFEKPDIKNHITILDERRNYKRGLDGFDPDCEIVELSNTLKNISIEKSQIIWNLLKNNYNKISGIVETSKRANYQDSEKNEELSIMGNILISFAWIPSKEGLFFKPSEITLDELHSDFNPESLESKKIAEKLKFKFDSESKIIEQLSPDKKKKFQLMEKLFSVMTEDAIEKFIKEKENINKKNSEQSHTNVLDKFKETLLKESVNNYNESEDLRVWKSVDPETVENAIENEREKIPEKIENSRVENLVKIVKQTKIINDEQEMDPRAFLIAQYDGCCQICNITNKYQNI